MAERRKNECINHEKNHVRKENHIALSQEPRQGDSQARKRERKRLIDKYPNKQHHKIKQFNLCRSKISLWKNCPPPPKTSDRKSKPEWELKLESQIRKLRPQAKIQIRNRNMKIYSDETEKASQKRKVLLNEMNQKILAKEGRLKRCWDRTKQYKQNRTF